MSFSLALILTEFIIIIGQQFSINMPHQSPFDIKMFDAFCHKKQHVTCVPRKE